MANKRMCFMHDLSLCRSIATTVRQSAGGRDVHRIHLQVGELRHIDPDHFAETWAEAFADTDLASAELTIEVGDGFDVTVLSIDTAS